MKELLIDREWLSVQGECVWIVRGGGSLVAAIPLGNVFGGNKASEIIDI